MNLRVGPTHVCAKLTDHACDWITPPRFSVLHLAALARDARAVQVVDAIGDLKYVASGTTNGYRPAIDG